MVTCYDTSGAVLEKVYQWDMNRAVTVKAVDAPAAPVFHFCAAGDKAALVVTPTSDTAGFTAQIPNLLLQQCETIYLYLTGSTGDEVATADVAAIAVEPRPKPADYAYVEDHQSVSLTAISAQVTAAIAAFQAALTTATDQAAAAAQQAQSAAAAATGAADGADTAASGAQSAQTAATAAAQAAQSAASAANAAANAATEAAAAANQAATSMGEEGVEFFNGRTGAVTPASGDYTAAQVGADEVGSAAAVQANLDTHTGNTNNPHGVTAAQVGARPDTWTPSAADVGAEPSGAVAGHNDAADAHSVLFAAKADKARVVFVTLTAAAWSGTQSPYTQTVTIEHITSTSKVDLQPAAAVFTQMAADGVAALYITNDNGTLTAYAVNAAPTESMTLQATVEEVSV